MMPATTTTPARMLNHGLDVWPLRGELFGVADGEPACNASTLDDMVALDDRRKPAIIAAICDNQMTLLGY
jgi:hypothetical protein